MDYFYSKFDHELKSLFFKMKKGSRLSYFIDLRSSDEEIATVYQSIFNFIEEIVSPMIKQLDEDMYNISPTLLCIF